MIDMKRLLTIMLATVISCVAQCVVAQSLTGEFLTAKIKEKAEILNDYQNMMSDKDKSLDIKRHYMTQALNLFVNQGEPFAIDSVKYQGASITTKSALRNKPVKRKVKDYLQGVMDLRYIPIDLTSVKIPTIPSQINLGECVKYADNQYRYTFLVSRELAGYIDGSPVYKDITPYEYTIFLSVNKTIDGTDYNVYLYDIDIDKKDEEKK